MSSFIFAPNFCRLSRAGFPLQWCPLQHFGDYRMTHETCREESELFPTYAEEKVLWEPPVFVLLTTRVQFLFKKKKKFQCFWRVRYWWIDSSIGRHPHAVQRLRTSWSVGRIECHWLFKRLASPADDLVPQPSNEGERSKKKKKKISASSADPHPTLWIKAEPPLIPSVCRLGNQFSG